MFIVSICFYAPRNFSATQPRLDRPPQTMAGKALSSRWGRLATKDGFILGTVIGCTTKKQGKTWKKHSQRSIWDRINVVCDVFFVFVMFLSTIWIPLTISTTKRVNTCLVPSSDSWIIQAKKMDPCTSFCSKRVCTVSCSGVPFYTHKSETHFVVIYFGMRCVVPETL